MKIAIAMTAFDRPEYLARTLDTYKRLRGVDEHDFYFVLEGPHNQATKAKCEQVRQVAESFPHPNKTIWAREKNAGVAHQIYESKQRLFDMGYDAVLSCVDDFLVAPYALDALLLAYSELDEYTSDLFTICVGSPTSSSQEDKAANLDLFTAGGENTFYLKTRKVWTEIEPIYGEYIRKFITPQIERGHPTPYRSRPSGEIRKWFTEILGRPLNPPLFASSQDGCVDIACKIKNIKKMKTYVNHAKCFGEMGEHARPSSFHKSRHGRTVLHEFDRDEVLAALSTPRFKHCTPKENL
ncbi:MAG: hypothetical protein CME17_01015 [Gemmatimonadetes bacterium]|nr:hypothetical protein [Gemmatimonadota bacterium]|tara:strand:- start:5192 stop:6079 length:888 start_codon:yes stop_codon:yes gene_type:complete